MNEKLITVAVVCGGILALAIAAKLGAPSEYIAAGGSALVLVANRMRSMFDVAQPPTDTEKKQ